MPVNFSKMISSSAGVNAQDGLSVKPTLSSATAATTQPSPDTTVKAQTLWRWMSSLKEQSMVDSTRVEELAQAIDSGNYAVDARQTAAQILYWEHLT